MKKKILFCDVDALTKAYISNHSLDVWQVMIEERSLNDIPEKDLEQYQDCEVVSVFTHSETLSLNKLDKLKNLKLLTTRSTGYDHIDLAYCKKNKIIVSNVPNYGEITVAEYSLALMLMVARNVVQANKDMKNNLVNMKDYLGIDLHGKTLGVVGTGAIGRHLVRLSLAFGMKVLAYDPFPSDIVKNLGCLYVEDIKDLFKCSDIISLNCPATKDNFHLLGKEAFSLMKKGVIIINTARGSLIDTKALYQALEKGKIGGIGLDVLEDEDILTCQELALDERKENNVFYNSVLNYKLLQSDKVIVTPHIAFNSVDAVHRILRTNFETIDLFFKGQLINTVI